MGNRNAFVDPATVRKELPDSDLWVEVKEQLTYGETKRLTGAALGGMRRSGTGDELAGGIDLEQFHLLRLLTWLVDWNFENGQGRRLPITRDTLANLRPAIGEQLDELLDAYITELEEKKASA